MPKSKDPEQSLRGQLRDGDYVAERTLWIRRQREMTEVKLAQARAELAPVPAVGAAVAAVASAVKQSTFAVPNAVSQQCVGKTAEEIQGLMLDALRQAFEPFNEEKIAAIIVAACERFDASDSAGPEAPAEADVKPVGGSGKGTKSRVVRKARKVGNGKR